MCQKSKPRKYGQIRNLNIKEHEIKRKKRFISCFVLGLTKCREGWEQLSFYLGVSFLTVKGKGV